MLAKLNDVYKHVDIDGFPVRWEIGQSPVETKERLETLE